MVTFVISQLLVTNISVLSGVAGCLAFLVIIVLSNDQGKPGLELFARKLEIFLIPLLMVFSYLAFLWAVKILTS